MDQNLKFTTSTPIDAPTETVWEALTNPEIIKKYFFGTDVETAWEKGSPIIWRGVWDGKQYMEKGEILEIEQGESVSYSYLADGLEDTPDNYSVITYELSDNSDNSAGTILTLRQAGFKNQKSCDQSKKNWESVLDGLKAEAERVI